MKTEGVAEKRPLPPFGHLPPLAGEGILRGINARAPPHNRRQERTSVRTPWRHRFAMPGSYRKKDACRNRMPAST